MLYGETSSDGLEWKRTGDEFRNKVAAKQWVDVKIPSRAIKRGWRVGYLGLDEAGQFFRVVSADGVPVR